MFRPSDALDHRGTKVGSIGNYPQLTTYKIICSSNKKGANALNKVDKLYQSEIAFAPSCHFNSKRKQRQG